MDERFKIVFAGELQGHIEAEEVIAHLVATFKLPEAQARALVLDGNRHVVKKNLDEKAAQRYRSALEEAGMIVQVEPMVLPAEKLSLTPLEEEAAAAPELAPQSAGQDWSAPGSESPAAGADPYAAPRADLRPPTQAGEMRGPDGVPAGHGWSWIVRGFWHFKTNPLAWILAVIILMGITIVLSLIPLVGALVPSLLGAVFTGGLMLGAQTQDKGGDFRVDHLFAGFKENFGQLLLVGVLYLVGVILISLLIFGLMLGSMIPLMAELDPTALQGQHPAAAIAALGPMGLIGILVGTLLFIPLLMSFMFAPALVMLDGLGATDAMKLSFSGCLKNILPFLIYGIAGVVLLILGVIPLGLGLLVVWPTLTAAIYVAYRDIYFEEAA